MTSCTAKQHAILVVDDHTIVREGVRAALESSPGLVVRGEAACGEEALRAVRTASYDAVVLDMGLPDLPGTEVLARMMAMQPSLPVVMFTMWAERHDCVRALRLGARGYVTKDADAIEIVRAVQSVLRGERYLSTHMASHVADALVGGEELTESPMELLSNREIEVFRFLAMGRSVKEIGERLCLSAKTVSTYRARVLDKLGVATNAELVRVAVECENDGLRHGRFDPATVPS